MAKEKKAAWWKMFAHQRAAVESVSDKSAGAGLKAAFRYFDGEDIPPGSITPQAFTVFCVIRPYIDEARKDFERSVENGKKGAETRWGNHTPAIVPPSPSMGCLREAEADISFSSNEEKERVGAAKPPKRPRFVKPTIEEINAYISEQGYQQVRGTAFFDFYEANGWVQGKGKPIRDWKAAVRTWARREGESKPQEPASCAGIEGFELVEEGGVKAWRERK